MQLFISTSHRDHFRSHTRVVVLGASGVGKTALIHQTLYKTFLEPHRRTIMNSYFCKGDKYLLEIMDTSGSHNFPEMANLAIIEGDVFVLVFSVTDGASFDRVVQIRKQVIDIKGDSVPIVLSGNKVDEDSEREIPKCLAESLSREWNCRYHEVTATNHNSCLDIFNDAISTFTADGERAPTIQQATVVDEPKPKIKRRRSDRLRASIAAFWRLLQ